jgi:hypothetical protein
LLLIIITTQQQHIIIKKEIFLLILNTTPPLYVVCINHRPSGVGIPFNNAQQYCSAFIHCSGFATWQRFDKDITVHKQTGRENIE